MRSMDTVDIGVEPNNENPNWERWNQRMDSLKEKSFPAMTLGASKVMERTLREAAVAGDIDGFIERLEVFMSEKQLPANVILEHPSPIGNTLLHVAADSRRVEITQLLASHFPNLLTKKNYQGDTALHLAVRAKKDEKTNHRVDTAIYLAARAKMLVTVQVLLKIAKKTLPLPNSYNDDTFLRMKNDKGNTALHEAVTQETKEVAYTPLPEAVMQERHKVAYCLIEADPEAAYCVNEDGKSPLYLAAELGNQKMLTLLLEEIATDGYAVLEKLKGEKSPVDAALLRKSSGMLQEIATKMPQLLHYIDKKGKSPFHYAASIDYVEGVNFLLKANEDGALVRDNSGFYPIHEACKNGRVEVVRVLLEWWSDPGEFLTIEGKNIFHVAAESGEEDVVKYLLHAPKLTDFVVEMVNQKDKEGNTPLHLATLHSRSIVVFRLVRSKKVDNQLKNGANLTAYDLAVEQSRRLDAGSSEIPKLEDKVQGKATDSELQDHKAWMLEDDQQKSTLSGWKLRESYDRMMTLSILQYAAHAPLSDKLRVQARAPSKEEVSASINSLIVVATLVAGATFAASIAIPGGDHEKEKETRNYRKVFVICDTVAMNMAIIAAIILSWAQQGDINIASLATWGVSWIVGGSLYMLCFAFLAAVLIAVSKYTTFAWIVVAIEALYIIIHTVLLVPLVMPSRIKQMLIRLFYLVLFYVYYIVVSFGKRSARKRQQKHQQSLKHFLEQYE